MRYPKSLRRERGVGILWAIGLLVLLATLSAVILKLRSAQSQAQALDAAGIQTLWAAQTGVEWGIARVMNNICDEQVWSFIPAAANPPGAPFAVRVRCTPHNGATNEGVIEGNNRICHYQITATACAGMQLATPALATPCPAVSAQQLHQNNYLERQVVQSVIRSQPTTVWSLCP